MVQSLGLTLYTLRSRHAREAAVNRPQRPDGPVVWMHAPKAESVGSLVEMARHLAEEDSLSVLLTCPHPVPDRPGLIVQPPPVDTIGDVRGFLDHWRPTIGIHADGELRPALLHEAAERGIPLMLVDGRMPYLLEGLDGWYPGLGRSAVQAYRSILAIDAPAARAFRKAGAAAAVVVLAGRLEQESAAMPCLEAERAALASLLATRPVWLASGLPEAEEAAVIAAHRATLGLVHRLLLIIAPEHAERAPALAGKLSAEEGWVVAQRALDEEPGRDVEVFITDGMSELGLWYRLAPITFLGGSLAGKGCLRNPMEPAALGSAILCGPRPGVFGAGFGRLGAARAARAVGTAQDLGEALSDLMAPDKVARLAQAAWGVISEGAGATERAVTIARDLLKERG